MSLADELTKHLPTPRPKTPVWAGPDKDGITFSLLSRYLCCKERFRILVIEGLKPTEQFNPRLEYGNLWHVCEEALARVSRIGASSVAKDKQVWLQPLINYCQGLCRKYPMQQTQVNHWYEFCKVQFPLYVEFWEQHPDVKDRTPLLQEERFNVAYKLSSGRTVRLRGKWDSVDLIGTGKDAAIFIQENKTKSQIDAVKMAKQLSFDLQTMIYLIALQTERERLDDSTIKARLSYRDGKHRHFYPITGVRYNVIRRSAHKSVESFTKKLTEDKADNRLGEWFARWKIEVFPFDVAKFRKGCLDPVLENLCDDYEWWEWLTREPKNGKDVFNSDVRKKRFPNHCPRHFRFPNGVYSPMLEGAESELDAYLATGSKVGLQHTENLFPELS